MRGARIKTMQKATVTDGTGTIELTWFNQPFLTRAILPNSTISASGKADRFGRSKNLSLQSPEYEILFDNAKPIHTGRLIPINPETQGISSKWLRRQIYTILIQNLSGLNEFLPENLIKQNHLMHFTEALQEIHFPKDLESARHARERLAFDELFLMQLAARKRREEWLEKQKGITFEVKKYEKEIKETIHSLPFQLTTRTANSSG